MRIVYAALTLLVAAVMVGCENLPGSREEQSTSAGAVTGAAAGAALADDGNELLGTLLGGALGAGGGYLVGARTDWFEGNQDEASEEAQQAAREAQSDPVTAEEAENASTADIDENGFVTMDEIIAMEEAGLTDEEIIDRLEASDVVFDLTSEQADRLVQEGVSVNVVNQLEEINRDERNEIIGQAP